ncbi:flagellar protein FlhE [Salinicola avicenniae]|uniref:flagellar protein FlhE n=1 Tax=Salinicola avicenniae TaxID=2916836 RepID=UPI0021F714CD|nr:MULTISPECIES: flagellar protein FlhE [unclassified Salinicola]
MARHWRANGVLVGCLLLGLVPWQPGWATAGSWVGTFSRLVVPVSDRPLESHQLAPPPESAGAKVTRVRWRFSSDAPAGAMRAWLCQGNFCIALRGEQGTTQQFAGRAADRTLAFRFQRLPVANHAGVSTVTNGQLIVDYRR